VRRTAKPWRDSPAIARIVNGKTESQIEEAFSFDYQTDYGLYYSVPEILVRTQDIRIEGAMFLADSEVGSFRRTLKYHDGCGVAHHDILEINPGHRGHGLAREHYTNVIRFYDRTPIRRVELVAYGDGPWIWPLFGFDLASQHHKRRLRRLAAERGFKNIPDASDLYAANLATAARAGIESLKELARLEECGLRMFLALDDRTHRAFLEARGILNYSKGGR
jgi:hypothetical protein